MTDDTYVYEDGIMIENGTVTGAGELLDVKKRQKLIKKINKYAAEFVKEFVNGNIPAPSSGDCWMCSMLKEMGDTDHLISHMDESYYVPSLLLNAIDEFPISQMAMWVIGEKWNNEKEMEFAYDIFQEQTKKSISKYMKRQLKLA